MHTKSIISNDRKCYVCGTTYNLHRHHCIYGTANRKKSEKWGLWVYLCGYHHNQSNEGVHYNIVLDLDLKRDAQKAFEALYSHDKWMIEFHKNWL